MAEYSEMDFMREQQQRQLDNDPNAMYANSMLKEEVNNILNQIDPDRLIEDIEHRLKGERKDRYSGEWVIRDKSKKEVSSDFINDFISFLSSIVNQSTTMSNFTAQEINNIMGLIINWLKGHIPTKAEVYGIQGDYTEYDRICLIILNNCFSVFKRALNGQESKRIFSVLRINESVNPMGKKKGFLDNFKFW